MASGNNALKKKQAIAMLESGRREIGAEAQWLKRELNPKTAAVRLAREHLAGAFITAFALGVVTPWIIFRKKSSTQEREIHKAKEAPVREAKPQTKLLPYVVGMLVKSLTPSLTKMALNAFEATLVRKQRRDSAATF